LQFRNAHRRFPTQIINKTFETWKCSPETFRSLSQGEKPTGDGLWVQILFFEELIPPPFKGMSPPPAVFLDQHASARQDLFCPAKIVDDGGVKAPRFKSYESPPQMTTGAVDLNRN
jgi:hypothetical protein